MNKMKPRLIYCKPCGKYLGQIREGTLYKKIVFLCDKCETKRLASDLAKKAEKPSNPLDFFGGIFK